MVVAPPERAPSAWGQDTLSQFIDTARNKVFASFANLRPQYQRLATIDAAFRLIGENLKNPPDWFVALFLLRAHSSFLGGAHLALAGQLPEAYMLLRGSLENAAYSFYFSQVPESHERWLRRHDSSAAKQVVQDEFRIRALLKLLKKRDETLGKIATTLYERTIDFGAHPNERGLIQMLTMSETDRERQLQVRYLTGHSSAMDLCLKTSAQVGVCVLKVFQYVFRERYDLLGLSDRLKVLEQGL
jgi:hypothetical protein